MVFRPLAGCGLFLQQSRELRHPCRFRPLAGCGLFPKGSKEDQGVRWSFRPLAGCGLFLFQVRMVLLFVCFRPLAGCGLFPGYRDGSAALLVSVPLRGVGCFPFVSKIMSAGLFPSPCGVWVVSVKDGAVEHPERFPSPCGVWVVSAKLHILSGATGKRIVNSAILLYHIGRCLSIAN